MKNITIQCDRCDKLIDGCIDETTGVTGGYYDVSLPGYWNQFVRWEEEKICDECMHSDPKYIKIYGKRNII